MLSVEKRLTFQLLDEGLLSDTEEQLSDFIQSSTQHIVQALCGHDSSKGNLLLGYSISGNYASVDRTAKKVRTTVLGNLTTLVLSLSENATEATVD